MPGFGTIGDTPLGGLPGPAGPAPVAGPPVKPLHRFIPAQFPPESAFEGDHFKRFGWDADFVQRPPHHLFSRNIEAQYPPDRVFEGSHSRRGGVSEDIFPPKHVAAFRRLVEAQYPPESVFEGDHLRRDGYSQDFLPAIFLGLVTRNVEAQFPPLDEIDGRARSAPARPPLWLEFYQIYQQHFRVAEDSYDLYELYVGEDAPVDFDASSQPVQTSATLPFSWTPTPPGAGTKTLHIVVRKRNAYNLQSFNVYERFLVIDAGGAEVPGPVSSPYNTAVYDESSGYIKVISKYLSSEDTSPADAYEVYIKIGSDPVPGVDTPAATGTLVFVGDEAGIHATGLGPYTPGTVAHVIVTAIRTSDSERGNSAVVQHTLALPLDLTDGDLFGGSVYEQR